MSGYVGLNKQGGFLRVNTAGDVLGRSLPSVFGQLLGILGDREGVEIHHTEDSVVGFLHCDPLQKRTRIVTKVERVRRGLHARKQPGGGHD